MKGPWGIEYVPYEWDLVKFVDHIVDERIKMGRPKTVTTEKHWELIEFIIRGWEALYPEVAHQYFKYMKDIQANANRLGVSREGEARIQNMVNVPESIYALIHTAFPEQKWDKKFVLKFAQRLPAFKGAPKL